jgi:hypothetical protein
MALRPDYPLGATPLSPEELNGLIPSFITTLGGLNGNGRHSRLMADLLIRKLGGNPFTWGGKVDLVSPSETRNQYLSALRAADNRDMVPLLLFARS